MSSIYDIKVTRITGEEIQLSEYKGKVLLIVNVASKCGFTPQYDGLQALYEKYRNQDFEILGFPANNFLHQEPGSNTEIQNFCRLNYGVTFPLFAKISVRGKQIHPLYEYLTKKKTDPEFAGGIKWNFTKFLVDRSGNIVGRFGSRIEPLSEDIQDALERIIS
ncbi:MAG: glutathione peroxidase [Candidatus Cloacimonetes bacterium]|nr:glutathione peroxidase [Candidatus Cloacimonadota bacterium]